MGHSVPQDVENKNRCKYCWEGIGFLIAAKSIFRFGDIKESEGLKLTEYFMIGTLLSFGMAIFTGLATLKLIELVNARF
jgi:hypothetical protein